ncbi:hypothetical protein FLJC2902T_31890 [Flavobacterium limnosediminis JC2902]|uniref:DUF2750 domain-containing protein n=1 Tax=Flavobacterium limnosediminis JC2902 TaxID=1341181 RepID=V6SEJ9_9FLAO|nr:DUF2750 domain-containing protein [Flavobacterium limnosediminis]ESU24657.1 hypothetical protein FLJC2902T_31890 [Flavobacterium limnosediminis JC2902]
MFKNHIDIRLKHEKFIKKVCETNIVYGLESEDGFATSSSNDLEDEDGEPIGIICFWSEKALANSCVKNNWEEYKPTEINLAEFIENWCIGIDNDGLLIGTNFDQNMFGHEVEGYELILELIDELKKNKKELEFQKFENLADLETQIKEVLE